MEKFLDAHLPEQSRSWYGGSKWPTKGGLPEKQWNGTNVFLFLRSVVDPNTLNFDRDPGFWPNLDPDPDPGLYFQA